jgi:hypothetical protein
MEPEIGAREKPVISSLMEHRMRSTTRKIKGSISKLLLVNTLCVLPRSSIKIKISEEKVFNEKYFKSGSVHDKEKAQRLYEI